MGTFFYYLCGDSQDVLNMNRLNIAKRHFRKYGLSENVLGEIVALLPEDETATEETIIDKKW
ncbi:MAG: hypothetical protein Q4A00_05035 [Flavobacteriaceae bacterium]|nr:hypothetical protein [Flavobacteriaceae bacterium]